MAFDLVPADEQAPEGVKLSDNSLVDTLGRGALGYGAGLLKGGVGVLQGANWLANKVGMGGGTEWDNAARQVQDKLTNDVNSFGTAGKVGNFAGQIEPYLFAPGTASTPMGAAGIGAASGAVQGIFSPMGTQDAKSPIGNAMWGAGTGAIGGFAGGKLADMLAPNPQAFAPNETSRNILSGVKDTIGEQASQVKKAAGEQFTLARKSGLKINGDALGNAVSGKFIQNLTDGNLAFVEGADPKLDTFIKSARDEMSGPMNIDNIQSVRNKLSTFIRGEYDPMKGYSPSGLIAINMRSALDDTLDKAAENSLVTAGDSNGIKAFQKGLNQWKDYRQTFTNSDVVRKLTNGQLSSDEEIFRGLTGGSSLNGGKFSRNYDELIKAAGNQAPQVKEALRRGVLRSMLENAGAVNGEGFDMGKLRNAWQGFTKSNGELRDNLFSGAEVKTINKAMFNKTPEKVWNIAGPIIGGGVGAAAGHLSGDFGHVGLGALGGLYAGERIERLLPDVGSKIGGIGAKRAINTVLGAAPQTFEARGVGALPGIASAAVAKKSMAPQQNPAFDLVPVDGRVKIPVWPQQLPDSR